MLRDARTCAPYGRMFDRGVLRYSSAWLLGSVFPTAADGVKMRDARAFNHDGQRLARVCPGNRLWPSMRRPETNECSRLLNGRDNGDRRSAVPSVRKALEILTVLPVFEGRRSGHPGERWGAYPIITTVLVAAWLPDAVLLAQTDRGSIRRTIVDRTGAGMPGPICGGAHGDTTSSLRAESFRCRLAIRRSRGLP